MSCFTCCHMARSTLSAMTIRPKQGTRPCCFCKSPSCKRSIGTRLRHEYATCTATETRTGKVYRRFWLCFQRSVVCLSHTDQHESAYFPGRSCHCAWHLLTYHGGRICHYLPGNCGSTDHGDV